MKLKEVHQSNQVDGGIIYWLGNIGDEKVWGKSRGWVKIIKFLN